MCETSSGFELDNVKNEAIRRDVLSFWQSKTTQFCETSPIFQVKNIKNDAILRDFLQTWKVECRADGLIPMRFAIFLFHLSKVLRLPRKSEARSYEVLHLPRRIISANVANVRIWCSKMQPLSGSAPGPPNMSDTRNASLQILFNACQRFWNRYKTCTFCSFLARFRIPCIGRHKTTLQRPKVARACGVFMCFYHFHFALCFAPQRRALFEHLNFQKCSEGAVFCTVWFRNVLRATPACTFWTS